MAAAESLDRRGVEGSPALAGGVGVLRASARRNARLAAIMTNVLIFFMKPPPHK
jgi:hypothetical protein